MERARTRSQASEPETMAAPSDAPEVLPRQAAAEVPTHGSVLPVFDPGLAAQSDGVLRQNDDEYADQGGSPYASPEVSRAARPTNEDAAPRHTMFEPTPSQWMAKM